MRAVVTGGAGFIGSHLVAALVHSGCRVTVVDNFSTGSRQNLAGLSGVVLHEYDVSRQNDALVDMLRGADCIFHLAARASVPASVTDPLGAHANNATATLVMAEAAVRASVPRIVYASTCAVYGSQVELPWRVDMLPQPASAYAASKLAGEHYLSVFRQLHGLEAVCLRYFNVYGPNQPAGSPYAAVIPRWAAALQTGERPVIHGDGMQTRDFIHIRDVVEATIRASRCSAGFIVLNVGSGQPVSLLELLRIFQGLRPLRPPTFEPSRPGDIRHSHADVTQTREMLGWTAATSLEEGLAGLLDTRPAAD